MLKITKAGLTALLTALPAAAVLAQESKTDCTTCPAPPCNWIVVVQGEPTPFIIAFVIVVVIAFLIGYAFGKSRGRSSNG